MIELFFLFFYTSQVTVLTHVLTNYESHCKNVIFRDRFSSILSYPKLASYCLLLLHDSYFCQEPPPSSYNSSNSSSIRRKMQNMVDFRRRFSPSMNNTWLKGNDWAITILQHVLTNLKSHCKNVIFRDRFSSILPNTILKTHLIILFTLFFLLKSRTFYSTSI